MLSSSEKRSKTGFYWIILTCSDMNHFMPFSLPLCFPDCLKPLNSFHVRWETGHIFHSLWVSADFFSNFHPIHFDILLLRCSLMLTHFLFSFPMYYPTAIPLVLFLLPACWFMFVFFVYLIEGLCASATMTFFLLRMYFHVTLQIKVSFKMVLAVSADKPLRNLQ